ncbi:MAG TPA: hypothetical protein V6D37_17975 [Candidatus Sericytochromatia bacterium]
MSADIVAESAIAFTHIRVSLQIISYPIATPHYHLIQFQIPQHHVTVIASKSDRLLPSGLKLRL